MTEIWKIAACVTLTGLLGADIGLQVASRFAAPMHDGVAAIQQPMKTERSQKAETNPKADDSNSQTLIIAALGAGTSILTLFVIGYQTLIFRGQHKIMEGQRRLMRRQANISSRQTDIAERQLSLMETLERALVLAEGPRHNMSIYRYSEDEFLTAVEMNFRNYGKSPAIVQVAYLMIYIGKEFPRRQFYDDNLAIQDGEGHGRHVSYYSRHRWPNGALSPGEDFGWFEKEVHQPLTADQIEAIKSGEKRLWLDGLLRYTDTITKGTRETHFRWVYDPQIDMMLLDDATEFNRYT